MFLRPFCVQLLLPLLRSFEDVKERMGTHTDVSEMDEKVFRYIERYLTNPPGNIIGSCMKICD